MRWFGVPLAEHYWVNKWCVDVHNIDSHKYFSGKFPLEIIEGHNKDLSKFIFNLWEPIWYFKKCKSP